MLKIYIARHGQDRDNANGILNGRRNQPLTELGMEQASNLAKNIYDSDLRFDAVYCSPLQRAFNTAKAITEALGISSPVVVEDLIEREFGVMTGQPASRIEELCAPGIIKGEKVTYFLNPQGAETFPILFERARRVLKNIQQAHLVDSSLLLVAHGDIGKMIYAAYYGIDWKEILTKFHFGNSELLLLSPDSPAEDVHVFKWH